MTAPEVGRGYPSRRRGKAEAERVVAAGEWGEFRPDGWDVIAADPTGVVAGGNDPVPRGPV